MTPGSNTQREVVLVVLAGVIALGGSYLGSRATIASERERAREERLAETRTKRAKVYADYLDAARRYEFKTRQLAEALAGRVARGAVEACGTRPDKRLDTICGIRSSVFDRHLDARADLQDALNQAYIFGSKRGVRVAAELERALPPRLDSGSGRFLVDAISKTKNRQIDDGFSEMLTVMCAEVSAYPRPGC